MLLVAIDTAGKSGGITLAEGDEHRFRCLETSAIAGGTFSAQLIPTLAALLNRHGLGVSDLGGLAAVSGPGSFTGLRVGLSAVKGLAEVSGKPIATVSLLEALASLAEVTGPVAAALNAGRDELYIGVYFVDAAKGTATLLDESLRSQSELLAQLEARGDLMLITSDEAIATLVSTVPVKAELVRLPDSQAIARLGLRKLLAGEIVPPEQLDANYIRRSDAEILYRGFPR